MFYKIPVLAICRGMQLVNVTLGGTLIADLEERGKDNHRRMKNADRVHSIQIESGTVLFELAGANQAIINSAHHQAVDRVAEDLIISAVSSSDLVIEALEWKNPAIHAPLLAVQWHPERAISDADGLSQSIRNWLLESARQHHVNKDLQ
jgi:putative glutamine amidotransferase